MDIGFVEAKSVGTGMDYPRIHPCSALAYEAGKGLEGVLSKLDPG